MFADDVTGDDCSALVLMPGCVVIRVVVVSRIYCG